jgi:hypothetical protein
MIHLVILAAAAAATPAPTSQAVIAPAVTAPAPAPIAPADPERLALAKTVVDAVWPLGTYERMARVAMGPMMESMFSSAFDGADPEPGSAAQRAAMAKTKADIQDGARNLYRAAKEAMIPIANRMEPGIREALARSVARKFDAGQLRDLDRFFETPTGRAYAHESLFLATDPEVTAQMAKMMPELMKAMPQVMAATAGPPPPRPTSNERTPPGH